MNRYRKKSRGNKPLLPSDVVADLEQQLKKTHTSKQSFHDAAMADIDREERRLQAKADELLEMRLSKEISKETFKTKEKQIKTQQRELNRQRGKHIDDEDFALTVSQLLELATRADELFQSVKPNQKLGLVNFVLQNLRLRDDKLLYEVKEPFNAVLEFNKHPDRFPGRDSNPDSEIQSLLSCR